MGVHSLAGRVLIGLSFARSASVHTLHMRLSSSSISIHRYRRLPEIRLSTRLLGIRLKDNSSSRYCIGIPDASAFPRCPYTEHSHCYLEGTLLEARAVPPWSSTHTRMYASEVCPLPPSRVARVRGTRPAAPGPHLLGQIPILGCTPWRCALASQPDHSHG